MLTKKRIPIGYEDFKRIIDGNFYYVDKTMLIRDIINKGGQTTLITRPRRFGKTLNFSMLKYFFGIEEKDSAYIFDGLKISEYYDELKEYRNAYPVISLSMKSGKKPIITGQWQAFAGTYKDSIANTVLLRISCRKMTERSSNRSRHVMLLPMRFSENR